MDWRLLPIEGNEKSRADLEYLTKFTHPEIVGVDGEPMPLLEYPINVKENASRRIMRAYCEYAAQHWDELLAKTAWDWPPPSVDEEEDEEDEDDEEEEDEEEEESEEDEEKVKTTKMKKKTTTKTKKMI